LVLSLHEVIQKLNKSITYQNKTYQIIEI